MQLAFPCHDVIILSSVLREMRDLLRGEGTVEGFVDWVDAIMEEKLFRVRWMTVYRGHDKMADILQAAF